MTDWYPILFTDIVFVDFTDRRLSVCKDHIPSVSYPYALLKTVCRGLSYCVAGISMQRIRSLMSFKTAHLAAERYIIDILGL